MIFNIIVSLIFTYYTIYIIKLFRKNNRNKIDSVNEKLNIDFGNLPAGMYYIEVKSQGFIKTTKLIKR